MTSPRSEIRVVVLLQPSRERLTRIQQLVISSNRRTRSRLNMISAKKTRFLCTCLRGVTGSLLIQVPWGLAFPSEISTRQYAARSDLSVGDGELVKFDESSIWPEETNSCIRTDIQRNVLMNPGWGVVSEASVRKLENEPKNMNRFPSSTFSNF